MPTPASNPAPGGRVAGMLDDPSLSRQWVARRLQRALSVERWGAPLRLGLSRAGGALGATLGEHARSAAQRRDLLGELIREVGSEPYGASGLGEPIARGAAALTARLARRPAQRLAVRLAEHTLAEYEALVAFVEDAPGIDPTVPAAIAPLHAQARDELAALALC